MARNIDATTPQLRVVEKMFEAGRTCDVNSAAPFLSKNYSYKTFPKTADLPDEAKNEHLENYGRKFASLLKVEVRVEQP